MDLDQSNQYRPLLEEDPPKFTDRVDTPWDDVPDLPSYNDAAYRRIVRSLKQISQDHSQEGAKSRGILVLGEAGTGKTHLLMRVAKNLSGTNHILFVRKPNNEDAVAQHVWSNIVNSLARTVPTSGKPRSQLDDLLAHVFSNVLIPGFERDVQDGTDVEQRQRWIKSLRSNPYNLFEMLGEGEKRSSNVRIIRKRTLQYLQVTHPDVDQLIARVLITYCFVSREDRKRMLLSWLSGQDIDSEEADQMRLPPSWVSITEESSDVSVQKQREDQALRAIRTIGTLSTHYQPLILAFDQLEGLRDEKRLTRALGDILREIFTMTPNLLVLTCIFPSLWNSWFQPVLDESAAQRIAQEKAELEPLGPQHATHLLEKLLESSFIAHKLPTSIYPFEASDVGKLISGRVSPRVFIQNARRMFGGWLDQETGSTVVAADAESVTQDDIAEAIRSALTRFEGEQRRSYGTEIPIEEDFFGRLKSLTQTVLDRSGERPTYDRAACGKFVMPSNFIVKAGKDGDALCIAVMNSEGNAFAARARNLNKTFESGEQFKKLLVVRDRRCRQIGARSQKYLQYITNRGGIFINAGIDEASLLGALYDTLVAIEEHDLSAKGREIDKRQFVEFLKSEGFFARTQFFRGASNLVAWFPRQPLSVSIVPAGSTRIGLPQGKERRDGSTQTAQAVTAKGEGDTPTILADVVLGDTELEASQLGILGLMKNDKRRLGVSLSKPQCIVVLGYMGSGKSYALGVLIENALLSCPGLVRQTRPLSVVAFNYRHNPESRFEYSGFSRPNDRSDEVEKLRSVYGVSPMCIDAMNIFGYEPELRRRQAEYCGLRTYPIQFRSNELTAEHWEILMKPPPGSRQSEYMEIIRDLIQRLFYEDRLTFRNLEKHVQTDERLSDKQRHSAKNRLSFAERWICDERCYEWSDVLKEGVLNIVDLRMQAASSSDALKLCLVITDLVRRTRNGVNKMVVFDEAHEYVDSKELVVELERAITQIRHDGLSFVLASQFPERIPDRVFKYLLTRIMFKIPSLAAIKYVQRAAPNLGALLPQQLSNLDLEQGVCFVQTDDDCSDSLMRKPQLVEIRPRCSLHGGTTIRSS